MGAELKLTEISNSQNSIDLEFDNENNLFVEVTSGEKFALMVLNPEQVKHVIYFLYNNKQLNYET